MRIAIIGAGWAGRRQVEAARELAGKVEVAALVDRDAAHLEAVAEEWKIPKRLTDFSRVLEDAAIEAVSLCTPHALHCPMAIAAAKAGKHILCEKPLALTVEEGQKMVRAAREHGVCLYVAESAAYTDEAIALRTLVRDKQVVGDPAFAKLFRGFRTTDYGYPGRRSWLARPEAGGTGTWMLHGIHLVGELRFVLGEPRSIYMVEHRTPTFTTPGVEASVCAMLVLDFGLPVMIVQSCENDMPADTGGWTVYGNRGTLRSSGQGMDFFAGKAAGRGDSDRPEETAIWKPPQPTDALSPYARELAAFTRYVAGSDEPTDGMSELRSLAVVEAGYESMRTGNPVELPARYPGLYKG